MPKVTQPLMNGFYEAFSNIFVFQRNPFGQTICRRKVVPAQDPTSAHVDQRAHRWAHGVHNYLHNNSSGESLTTCVVDAAISPDSPKNPTHTDKGIDESDPVKRVIEISWDAVTNKYNGWPLNNLAGYFINLSTDYASWQRLPESPIVADHYDLILPADNYYITVQAIDTEENISSESDTLIFTVTI
ncbi:MAG: hypothetical protein U5R06_02270 [candidate division KSB1 bacterium]|nr:hypothetical protein [candidate division KSB1 bacterium]